MNFGQNFLRKRGVKITTGLVFFLCLFFLSATTVSALELPADASISGQVFNDLNINESLDFAEPGLENWQVNLLQDGRVLRSTVTSADGAYVFSSLAAGHYELAVQAPAIWAAVGTAPKSLVLGASQSQTQNLSYYQVIDWRANYGPMLQLSNISVEAISPTAVRVIWFSNYEATGQIIFGAQAKSGAALSVHDLKFGYARSTAVDFAAKTYHTAVISGLQPGSRYYYRVVSLPNPRQWRGSPYVLSEEETFETSGFAASAEQPPSTEVKPANIKKIGGKLYAGKILSEEMSEEEANWLKNGGATSTSAQPQNSSWSAVFQSSCAAYIWLLGIINLALAVFLWRKFNRQSAPSALDVTGKLWWLALILIIVPLILGYPECWLVVWLFFTLALALACLLLIKPARSLDGLNPTGGKNLYIAPDVIESSETLIREEPPKPPADTDTKSN